jgi:hypothetical protein
MINYLKVYYLNDKGLHDFEKRMISKSDKTGQLDFNSQFAMAHDCMNNAISKDDKNH